MSLAAVNQVARDEMRKRGLVALLDAMWMLLFFAFSLDWYTGTDILFDILYFSRG